MQRIGGAGLSGHPPEGTGQFLVRISLKDRTTKGKGCGSGKGLKGLVEMPRDQKGLRQGELEVGVGKFENLGHQRRGALVLRPKVRTGDRETQATWSIISAGQHSHAKASYHGVVLFLQLFFFFKFF